MSRALGLIETKGLVGAIEAADAMVKAANVTIVGKEKTVPAMITIQIAGEVAAVRSAIDAGAAAAQRVGQLISVHIIPQPDDQMAAIIPQLFHEPETYSSPKVEVVKTPLVKKTEASPESQSHVTPDEKSEPLNLRSTSEQELQKIELVETEPVVSSNQSEPEDVLEKLDKTTKFREVSELEQKDETSTDDNFVEESLFKGDSESNSLLADNDLSTETEEIKAPEITQPEPEPFDDVTEKMFEDLPDNFSLMESDIYSLNVHQLRKLARQIDNFPIQGREISKANRNELLRHFEALRSP